MITTDYTGTWVMYGYYAFNICGNLQTIELPSTEQNNIYNMFYGCSKLKSVSLLCSKVSNMDYVFYDCTSIQSMTLIRLIKQKFGGSYY